MILGIDLFQYKMVKTMTGGSKVLLLSVKKDTGEERFFEEKDSLANRKEESQSKVTKRKKKK